MALLFSLEAFLGRSLAFATFMQWGQLSRLCRGHDLGSLKVQKMRQHALSWCSQQKPSGPAETDVCLRNTRSQPMGQLRPEVMGVTLSLQQGPRAHGWPGQKVRVEGPGTW